MCEIRRGNALPLKIIGLTGGIGSGKSTVSKLLEIMGIPVYIADTESKKLSSTSPLIRKLLIERFGPDIYRENEINRKLLASLIFENPQNLQYVNSVIHPVVRSDFKEWIKRHGTSKCLAIETAILFESCTASMVDFSINVSAPLELRVARVMERDHVSQESVLSRINNQISDEEKNRLADYIVLNDGCQSLILQVEKIINNILIS